MNGVCHTTSRTAITAIGFVTTPRWRVRQAPADRHWGSASDEGPHRELVIAAGEPRVSRRTAHRAAASLSHLPAPRVVSACERECRAFGYALARAASVPADVVHFALLDEDGWGAPLGAAANALLLHNVGEVVMLADKMVGPAVLLAPLDERIAVTDGGDPRRLRFFPDRAAFRKSIYATRVDVVRAHEELIGRTMHEDEPAAAAPDAHVTSDEERSSRDRPSIRTSRVALTASGQTNAASPDGGLELLAWSDVARECMLESAATYRRTPGTGEWAHALTNPTISRQPCSFASSLAIDNRTLVPPFMPVGGDPTAAFARLLSMCTPDACFGYVPPLVPGPAPASSTSDVTASAGRGFPDLIALLSASVSLPPGAVQSAERMQGLGLGLRALGMLPVRAFLERVHHVLEDDWRRAADRFDWMLTASNTVSSDWTTDVERCLQRVADAAGADARHFRLRRAGSLAALAAQRLVRRYGELLYWWPAIVDGAAALRAHGYRLATPV